MGLKTDLPYLHLRPNGTFSRGGAECLHVALPTRNGEPRWVIVSQEANVSRPFASAEGLRYVLEAHSVHYTFNLDGIVWWVFDNAVRRKLKVLRHGKFRNT